MRYDPALHSLMTAADYGRRTGRSRQYISGLVAENGIPVHLLETGESRIIVELADVVLGVDPADPADRSGGNPGKPLPEPETDLDIPAPRQTGGSEGSQVALQLKRAQLQERQLGGASRLADLQERCRALVPAAEVERRVMDAARAHRDALLALPALLAEELAALAEPRDVRGRLDTALRASLERFVATLRTGSDGSQASPSA